MAVPEINLMDTSLGHSDSTDKQGGNCLSPPLHL
jgi:hypothetical protein